MCMCMQMCTHETCVISHMFMVHEIKTHKSSRMYVAKVHVHIVSKVHVHIVSKVHVADLCIYAYIGSINLVYFRTCICMEFCLQNIYV